MSPAEELSTVVLLMHSPSVGPSTWEVVAGHLRDVGVDVRAPSFMSVGDGPAPYWPYVIQRAVDAVGNDPRPVVIVPHSNAGLFVPLVVGRLGERAAACGDLYATSSDVASLPPDVRADVLARIREISQSRPEVLEFPARSVVDLCFADVTAG